MVQDTRNSYILIGFDVQAARATIESKYIATIYTLHAIYMKLDPFLACSHEHAALVVSSVHRSMKPCILTHNRNFLYDAVTSHALHSDIHIF